MNLKKAFLTIIFLALFVATSLLTNVIFADHQCPDDYFPESPLGINLCTRPKPPDCRSNEEDLSPYANACAVDRISHQQPGQEPGDQTPGEGVIPSPKLPGPDDAPELAGLAGKGFSEENLVGKLVSDIIPIILGLAGFLTVIFIVISGIQFITSSGNPEAAAAARARLTFALVGFIIIILAFAITQLVDTIFLGGSGIF